MAFDSGAFDSGSFEIGSGGQSYSYTATGGLALSGAAPIVRIQAKPVTGGIILSGAAAVVRNTRRAASGGIQFAGHAVMSSSAAGYVRALILVGGLLRVIQDADIGTGKKPIVYIDARLRQRLAAEGTPIVIDGGRIRLMLATETLQV